MFQKHLSLVFTSDADTSGRIRELTVKMGLAQAKGYKIFHFLVLALTLALCENETQHKHKDIYCVWPIEALAPDSPRLKI